MKPNHYDLILVGGGIMSATLATLVHLLDPSRRIALLEQCDDLGQESSHGWNNAGTGHAGFCELNYTPANAAGRVDPARACDINARFEVSMQFWAGLAERGILSGTAGPVRTVPHLSWVTGDAGVRYLRERYRALQALTRYLLREGLSSFSRRFAQLQTFLPDASPDDWSLRPAGQRVQIIRRTATGGAELAFGTEVLLSENDSLGALLGASPGASVSVDAMLEVLSGLMPELLRGIPGQRLNDLIPVRREALLRAPEQIDALRPRNARLLGLVRPESDWPDLRQWSGAA